MPIYSYECQHCKATLDQLQKHGDQAPACPECGHTPMTRILGPSHFRLRTNPGDVGGPWTGSVYSRFRRDQ